MKVKTSLKACGVSPQHNRRGLKVRSSIKAGGICYGCGGNHSRNALKVRSSVKAGGFIIVPNHTRRLISL